MIKTIELRNFECHTNTVLDLSPGFTAITGLSDQGKSSIRRAIEWVFFNRPSNTSMLRKKGMARVILTLADGNVIERFRSKSKNGYKLNDDKVFTALRRAVPDEIKSLLGVVNTNVQSQMDQYFLLELTSGKIARQLNEVTNLQIADEANDILSKQIRQQGVTLKATEQRIDYLTGAIHDLDWVAEAKDKLKRADAHEEIVTDLRGKIDTINQTVNLIGAATEELRRFDYVAEAETQLAAMTSNLITYVDLESTTSGLQQVIGAIGEAEKKIAALGDIDERKKLSDNLASTLLKWKEYETQTAELSRHLSEITEHKATVDRLDGIVNKEKELSTTYAELKELNSEFNVLRERILTIKVCRNFMGKLIPESAQDLVEQLGDRIHGILDMDDKKQALAMKVNAVLGAQTKIENATAVHDQSEAAFEQFMASIDTCPLCGHSTGEENTCDHE